jgi:hypothetical protein
MQIPIKDPSLSMTASRRISGVDMHGTAVWAFNPMYGSIHLPMSFVVGEMVAHQIQHKADQEFGKNWDKGQAQPQATSTLRGSAEHGCLMRRGTGPLTPRYLIRFLAAVRAGILPEPGYGTARGSLALLLWDFRVRRQHHA